MKTYPCYDCGSELDPRYLWVCEDDKLRCGHCIDEWMRDNRATECSAIHDYVDGLAGEGR